MRLMFGGVRGSSPLSHPDFTQFGGATTCVLVEDETDTRIVLDAGTGLRTLGPRLVTMEGTLPILMLLTHYHLDHVIGLPTFAPLYDPNGQIVIAAPRREGITAEAALGRLVAAPFWPVAFRARQRYVVLREDCNGMPFRYGPFDVRWCAVHHRNGCHAYRFDERRSGRAMAFATDLEWGASDVAEREALLKLCREPRPVDVLVMDGHFDASTGAQFKGWGHSTWQDAVQVAMAAAVRQLIVTHHAPDADDGVLARRSLELQIAAKEAGLTQACFAREGMDLFVSRNT
jgi:phosphoribosyl 1,2-cyclic phosphodiesterase